MKHLQGEIQRWSHVRLGNFKWADGTIFTGNYLKGYISGRGEAIFPSGDKYIGDWLNDKIHGNGVSIYNYGKIYDGELKDGKRHGNGKYFNTIYDGV